MARFITRFLNLWLSLYSEWNPEAVPNLAPASSSHAPGPWSLLYGHVGLLSVSEKHETPLCLDFCSCYSLCALSSALLSLTRAFSARPPEGSSSQTALPPLCSRTSSGIPSQWGYKPSSLQGPGRRLHNPSSHCSRSLKCAGHSPACRPLSWLHPDLVGSPGCKEGSLPWCFSFYCIFRF